jgi:hypothetical protein
MCCAVWGSHVLSVVGRRPDLEPQCSGEVGQGDGADGQGQGIESRQKTGQRRQSQSGLWRARSRSSWQSNSTHRPRFNRVTPRRGGRGAHGAIWGSRYRLAVSDDRTEGDIGDILDAIITEGSCKACGTPWAFVVKMEGDRLVKIEGGCTIEVCVLGDW